jgi:hypothetical protein
MKLGLQNYTVITLIEKSYIIFNNNKINSLQHITLHKITEFYLKQFSVCPNITSKCRTNAILKISVKENNDSNKTCKHVHNISMYRTSLCLTTTVQ